MSSRQIRVLHVDDDPEFVSLTQAYLEREDDRFVVETVTDAEAGLERIADVPPDCIVSDYDMPGMDGVEFLQAVRETHPALPFVLFTGRGSEAVASEAIAAGVTDYIQKASGTEQYELLSKRIRNAVRSQRETQRADRQEELMRLTEVAGDTGGWELDLDTDEVVLTPGARRLAGTETERLQFDEWLGRCYPDDQGELRAMVDRAVETGEQTSDTKSLRSADGTRQQVAVTVTPATTEAEETIVRGAINDITEYTRREQKLRQFRELLESINDAVFVVNQDQAVVYANKQSLQNVNLTAEEADGQQIIPLVEQYAVDRAGVAEFERALATALDDTVAESPDPVRLTVAAGGSEFVYEHRFSRVPTEHVGTANIDVTKAVAVVAREITDRVERTTELRRTRELLHEMERIADIGAWEFDPEDGGLTATAGIRRIYAGDPEADLSLDETFGLYHPDDRERLEARVEDCLETGEPYDLDLRLTGVDGEERWVTARGESVQTRGQQHVLRGYVQDITEKKRRRKRLEQAETLFEHARDMLFVVKYSGDEFVVQRVNKSFESATGLAAEDLQGKTPSAVFGEERGRQIEQQYRRCVETGEALSYEETLDEDRLPGREAPTDDGLTHWETRIVSVEASDGVEYIVGVTRSIDDQKRREQELKRQNERLDEFTSIVSHDLRNPLAVADGHLTLAQQECDTDRLDPVADAIARSQDLVEELLVFARSDDEVRAVETVSVASAAEQAWEMVPTAEATLVIDSDRSVAADAGQLQQLLENLFDNAVQHGGESVTVVVGASADGFYVADDGPRLPEDSADLFDAGYSTADDGTGFGLRIVEQITSAHGWDVEVSEHGQSGARFEITGVDAGE